MSASRPGAGAGANVDGACRLEWARQFAAYLARVGSRLTAAEALEQGWRLFPVLGSELTPKAAADAITRRPA